MKNPRIIILGANGLIGSTLYYYLRKMNNLEVFGTIRKLNVSDNPSLIGKVDFLNTKDSFDVISDIAPSVVINCVGITKHSINYNNIGEVSFINSILPHLLSDFSNIQKFKLIHISSDCVFDGQRGNYSELDLPNSQDLYGKSKFLGELDGCNGSITIRTSTIGHENYTKYGLLEWFLSQDSSCEGFSKAFFSGLTTLELASILYKHFIFDDSIFGLYNLAGPKINKFDLLKIIAKVYEKDIEIKKNEVFFIDRSLNASKFNDKFGYYVKSWDLMIKEMKEGVIS
jgi:dTDP-4-dehydrorhamnose reductase